MKAGLTKFMEDPFSWIDRHARVGLLTNPTAVDADLRHIIDLFVAHPDIHLTTLMAPEHGLGAGAQDMVAIQTQRHKGTGLPLISLYGERADTLSPPSEALQELDVLVFDIQDVGSRYYTYAATLALCMQACVGRPIKVVVLDRPNVIGGVQVEGGGLDEALRSFVGLYPIPQRHGMTVGELARLYHDAFAVACDLLVVPCEGWRRHLYHDQTGLPWVIPSPNMPTLDTAIVYPGMCLLEGTNLSEGRGTTRPFELCGAPFIDGQQLAAALVKEDLCGVAFRPCTFVPTFQKWAQQPCGGVQLHIRDRNAFLPLRTGLAVLKHVRDLWPNDFAWRQQAYEFRSDVPAIDLLTGFAAVRQAIDAGRSLDAIYASVCQDADLYAAARANAIIYA